MTEQFVGTRSRLGVDLDNGGWLQFPPYAKMLTTAIPAIWKFDTTQKYDLGTFYRTGGRTYVYAKSSGTQIPDVGSQIGSHQHIAQCYVGVDAAQYDTSIVLDRASTDGAAHDGVIAKDELMGGWVFIFPSANHAAVRMIVGNSATIAGSTREIQLDLDMPIPEALTADSAVAEAMASPYLNVVTAVSEYRAVVGVPTVRATTGTWFWLQTWGPCWCASAAGAGLGASDQNLCFRYNGAIDEIATTGYNSIQAQHAGFVMSHAYNNTQGAPFFMLQITP